MLAKQKTSPHRASYDDGCGLGGYRGERRPGCRDASPNSRNEPRFGPGSDGVGAIPDVDSEFCLVTSEATLPSELDLTVGMGRGRLPPHTQATAEIDQVWPDIDQHLAEPEQHGNTSHQLRLGFRQIRKSSTKPGPMSTKLGSNSAQHRPSSTNKYRCRPHFEDVGQTSTNSTNTVTNQPASTKLGATSNNGGPTSASVVLMSSELGPKYSKFGPEPTEFARH